MNTINVTIGGVKFPDAPQSRYLTYKQQMKGIESIGHELTDTERVEHFRRILDEPMRAGGVQYLTTDDKQQIHTLIRSNLDTVNAHLNGKISFEPDGRMIYRNNGVKAHLIIFCKKLE